MRSPRPLIFFALVGLGCGPKGAVSPAAPALAKEPVLPHQSFMLTSKILGEARRINVFTPSGYDDAPSARYPVLYMPDGGVEEDFPHVTTDIDQAIRKGEMRAVIVVGIENTERRRDMTGPTVVLEDKKIAPHVGGSAAFRGFLRDELVPEIERRVRGDGKRAIVGESLAGLFVMETFFEEPRLFDVWIALSPSLWWNDGALAKSAASRLRARTDWQGTLFVATASDDDIDEAAGALVTAFTANAPKTLAWSYEARPDLKHETIYRGASPAAFRRLFALEKRDADKAP